MKKFSISLFAVLAIVFAVSSAFKTSKSFTPNTWEKFGVTVDALDANPTTPAVGDIYDEKISDNFNATAGSPGFSDITAEISAYNQAHQLEAQVRCAEDTENMCAAIVSYNSSPSSELALVDFDFGDYSLSL
jgi:hypothetical protein